MNLFTEKNFKNPYNWHMNEDFRIGDNALQINCGS